LINSVIGSHSTNSKDVSIIPGQSSLELIEIENKTNEKQIYKIVISD
jgi:hypothetical protein